MEVATAASSLALHRHTLVAPPRTSRNVNLKHSFSPRASLSTNFVAPFVGGSVSSDFSGHKLRPSSLNPASFPSSKPKRGVVTMVIPFVRGSAREQPPPDLASYLYKNRIVYLGMSLVPSVTELILAEFLYLQYEDEEKPIYLYINSTGTTKGGEKLSYETEAFAIYDVMRYVKPPIFTLCVGNAWGEAALLLAAGAKGNRSALPSSTIMIKQPIARFQGQASDIELARKEIKNVKAELVNLLAKHVGKSPEQVDADIRRPKYFSPSEAVEYGIIDKVLYNERSPEDRGVVSDLKKAKLI
ncbi:ATP-dependent Clp protease proteolytic subunit-related protein 4, chloroplastic [Quercus robur]|uniref:ATP-dependent Clp protease proteolytic subunit-related protein 4, chloroplastic n=1 Tax=Quercus robur TaxID=38942 RepID=UPI0021616576|nr:ATP-dependent Clp protease proteolytic subunit-related protein 4, chloroplastic [Quercus robur]